MSLVERALADRLLPYEASRAERLAIRSDAQALCSARLCAVSYAAALSTRDWTYVVRLEIPARPRPLKIGTSVAPFGRLQSLQTGTPFDVSLIVAVPGVLVPERVLHKLFESDRIRGEWFKPARRLWRLVNDLRAFEALQRRQFNNWRNDLVAVADELGVER